MRRVTFSVDDRGLLRAMGSQGPRVIVVFTPDGLGLECRGVEPALLAWDHYDTAVELLAPTIPPTWNLTEWTVSRGGSGGLAIRLRGRYACQGRQVIRAATPPLQRRPFGSLLLLLRSGSLFDSRKNVPIVPTVRRASPAENATLAALFELLRDRPGLRSRLAEPTCMHRLARDLTAGAMDCPRTLPDGTAANRDLSRALRRCGLVYRYGRPLSTSEVPIFEEALARFKEEIQCRPGNARSPSDKRIKKFLVRYHARRPWPFAAIMDD